MSPPGDYTTQSFRGESHLEAMVKVSNEKREGSKDAFRAGAPGSVIEIYEDKENLAVYKQSAKRRSSDEHCTRVKRRKALESRDSSPTIWQGGTYSDELLIVKWRQTRAEEYHRVTFTIPYFYPGSGGRFEDFQKDLKGAIRPDTVARDGGNDTEVQESEREVEIQDSEDEWN
uniref:Uncharacterized protein n=1 Tax=Bionectria ochroleuca TaxID=29856 RepID=A0A8H7K5D3_BIOOC